MNRRFELTLLTACALLLLVTGVAAAKLNKVYCDKAKCEGTKLADDIQAGAKDNVIHGRAGDDEIRPGGGNDTVYAGGGDDYIWATSINDGGDTIYGGGGDDEIHVEDGNHTQQNKDHVDCGPGYDTVYFDSKIYQSFGDTVVDCESVHPDVSPQPGPGDLSP